MIAPKPGRLDDATAAAIPVVAVTAQQALFEQARLVAGQTVLIHGAGGSVGILAVQLARQAGLRIIATAGARDLDRLHRLGARRSSITAPAASRRGPAASMPSSTSSAARFRRAPSRC
jgi:NADPH:quinone reductase and related Zn-dependent oxidoreductases